MIVLTVIADSNDHTVRFREPLGKLNYIRLLSCPLYNSWYNLKRRGEISISDRQNNASIEIIPPGKYNLEGLAKAFGKILLLGIDQRLQGKKSPQPIYFIQQLPCPCVIFWTRMKTYSMGNPREFLVALTLLRASLKG